MQPCLIVLQVFAARAINYFRSKVKMAPSELDSFYFKFKNLLFAEKDATLTLKSKAGRAQVTLCVDLGHVLSRPGPHLPHDARSGTSRSRRREQRAEARRLVAAEAEKVDKSTATDITEEVISVEKPVEAEECLDATLKVAGNVDATEKCNIGEVIDEVCSNEQYETKVAKSEEEFLEYFKVLDIDSKKPEEEIVKDILKTLDSKLKKAKFKEPNEVYKFIKSGKCNGNVKLFVKAKNIPGVLSIITNLSSKNIEVTKMPKWRR